MARTVQVACLLLLTLPASFGQRAARAPGKRPPAKRPPAIVERWNRLTPEERQRMLQRLPPGRREQLESRLERYNNLPKDEKEQLGQRFQAFQQLPSGKQEQARRLFRRFTALPEERRPVVREEFDNLRSMTDGDRRARINSEEFRNKYTLAEQQLLQDFSAVIAPEPKDAAGAGTK
jgi:hypothetical protein